MDKKRIITPLFFTVLFITFGLAATAFSDPQPAANPEKPNIVESKAGSKEAKFAGKDEKTASFFQKAVEEYLSSRVPENISDWRISNIGWTSNEKLPNGFDDYKITPQKGSTGADIVFFTFEFTNKGQIIKKISVNAKVEMFAELVVAKERIPRGSVLTREMVNVERKLLTIPADDAYTRPAEVEGRVAERNILQGKVVQKSQLGKVADVKAGDIVMIVAQSESLRLTARGIAKKDGTIGEMIPVINLRSNKKLNAKVVDSGTVQVEF